MACLLWGLGQLSKYIVRASIDGLTAVGMYGYSVEILDRSAGRTQGGHGGTWAGGGKIVLARESCASRMRGFPVWRGEAWGPLTVRALVRAFSIPGRK